MMPNWYDVIRSESRLAPEAARQLCEIGFLVMPGPVIPGGCARLADAYDKAVLTADPEDVSVRSSTRVHDFVNRGPEFDDLYIYPPVLAACWLIIGRPFKLSAMLARTLEPGAQAQPLHVDVKRGADGWPLVGFIAMVDEFSVENGATCFAPGSHLMPDEPGELVNGATDTRARYSRAVQRDPSSSSTGRYGTDIPPIDQPAGGVRSRAPLSRGTLDRQFTRPRGFVTRHSNASGISRSISWMSTSGLFQLQLSIR